MSVRIEGVIVAAIVAAAGVFALVRILRLARNRRPDCCSGGASRRVRGAPRGRVPPQDPSPA